MFALFIHLVALSTHYCTSPPASQLTTKEKIETWLLLPALVIGWLAITVKIIFINK